MDEEQLDKLSPSSQRAWIEIPRHPPRRKGSTVALLAEGVDRNSISVVWTRACMVALLAEGVDRNPSISRMTSAYAQSPSSQRAWIEIAKCWP